MTVAVYLGHGPQATDHRLPHSVRGQSTVDCEHLTADRGLWTCCSNITLNSIDLVGKCEKS